MNLFVSDRLLTWCESVGCCPELNVLTPNPADEPKIFFKVLYVTVYSKVKLVLIQQNLMLEVSVKCSLWKYVQAWICRRNIYCMSVKHAESASLPECFILIKLKILSLLVASPVLCQMLPVSPYWGQFHKSRWWQETGDKVQSSCMLMYGSTQCVSEWAMTWKGCHVANSP